METKLAAHTPGLDIHATKSKANWTPGPWYAHPTTDPSYLRITPDADGEQGSIAHVYREGTESGSHEERLANANLIAASPRLLEACRAVLLDWSTRPVGGPAVMLGTIERLQTAVREAEGG